ncbi:Gpn2 [Scenedesmus sp. PABB004]|nr:Gpn2 [Scenedesmus sp. PABB004]
MVFGQLVIGPPGSGKTTYCRGVSEFLAGLGRRVAVVNLDPANDGLPYTPDVDVGDLVSVERVMEELRLGPNGAMLYAMEHLAANLDWLKEQLEPLEKSNAYVLFDCPGQVELFTQHRGFKAVLAALTEAWGHRLAAVHLVDAHLATDAPKYISALLLSLSTMLHLELPQVNVLSKVDLVKQYGDLAFNLDFYTEVHDLSRLVAAMGGGPFSQRFRKLSAGLCDVVEGYGLVAFTPLAIQDARSVRRLVGLVDKASGAAYARLDGDAPPGVPAQLLAASGHSADDDDLAAALQEAFIDDAPPPPAAVADGLAGPVRERAPPAMRGRPHDASPG